ncbi:cation:proton antiporter [Rhizobium sp. NPDC090279]|uniref:cation:proton antiporter n=1 Tax=Rhizobium sp. NPDC090279 TaxID=3364499 RepID=UPI00383AF73A
MSDSANHIFGCAISWTLLLLAGVIATRIARGILPPSIPDIPIYLITGMLFGMNGLTNYFTGGSIPVEARWGITIIQFAGLFLLIFSSCAELQFTNLRQYAVEVTLLVGASLMAMFVALLTVPLLSEIAPEPQFVDVSVNVLQAHFLALSLGVTVTSLPFLTKIFINTGLLRTPLANSVLVSACFVDIFVWAVFAVALTIHAGGASDFRSAALQVCQTIAILSAILAAGMMATRLIIRLLPGGLFAGVTAILVVSTVVVSLAAVSGLGTLLGIVVSGLAIGSMRSRLGIALALVQPLSARVGAPLYFTCVGFGMSIDSAVGFSMVVAFFVWSSVLKIGSVYLFASLIRRPGLNSLDFAIAMNTRGGPGLVLAAAAYSSGIVGPTGFVALVTASILTALLTEIYLKHAAPRILAENPIDAADGNPSLVDR